MTSKAIGLSILITSLWYGLVHATERLHLEAGVGMNEIGKVNDSSKYLAIAMSQSATLFELQPEIGVWFDNRKGCTNSAFITYMAGIEPRAKGYYVRYLLGPAYITNTDNRLGSNFQFTHELGVGVKDSRGVRLGIVYRHFSNAGLIQPNEGKDFCGLNGEVKF